MCGGVKVAPRRAIAGGNQNMWPCMWQAAVRTRSPQGQSVIDIRGRIGTVASASELLVQADE
jgi:hypothetical protein